MNELEIKKGDKFNTQEFGLVTVTDIFISITDQGRVFEVASQDDIPFTAVVYVSSLK